MQMYNHHYCKSPSFNPQIVHTVCGTCHTKCHLIISNFTDPDRNDRNYVPCPTCRIAPEQLIAFTRSKIASLPRNKFVFSEEDILAITARDSIVNGVCNLDGVKFFVTAGELAYGDSTHAERGYRAAKAKLRHTNVNDPNTTPVKWTVEELDGSCDNPRGTLITELPKIRHAVPSVDVDGIAAHPSLVYRRARYIEVFADLNTAQHVEIVGWEDAVAFGYGEQLMIYTMNESFSEMDQRYILEDAAEQHCKYKNVAIRTEKDLLSIIKSLTNDYAIA